MTLIESTPSSQYENPAGEIFSIDRQLAQEVLEKAELKADTSRPDLSWRVEALCRDSNPELFFPIGSTGRAVGQIEKARRVCLDCPAREACLGYALETNQDSGVWGGSTAEYRRDLRRSYFKK